MLTPIIAVVMTFSVLFTFTDFQLIYVLTRGGPMNATHLMATLSFQRAIPGGELGEGAAIAVAMIPFLLAAILFSYFGLQRRRWQQGGEATDEPDMAQRNARRTATTPAAWTISNRLPRRLVTLYLPLAVFVFVLLFPFYWMTITAFKPNEELTELPRLQSALGGRIRRSTTSKICCSTPPIRAGCGTRC